MTAVNRLIVTASELAAHWGLTDRRLRELIRDGIAVRGGRGFDLRESDRRYIEKLRSQDESRQAKVQLLKRQTQRAEVELARDAKALMTRADAEAQCLEWWSAAWGAVASAISRLFHDLPGSVSERRVVCSRLHDEIRGELILHRDRIRPAFLAPDTPHAIDERLKAMGIDTR